VLRTRFAQIAATVGLSIAVASAPSSAAVGPTGHAAGAATIKVASTLSGTVVTNTRGDVLFMFPKEGHSIAFCLKTKSCLTDWPLVTTTGKPVAGVGLNPKLLRTIPYRGRLREVTYNGWPLHTYKFAYSAQSSVMNIGIKQFGGPWYALNADGKIVK
jgi:predicted lipoprotein with Yx(FWY)xxD motif